MKIHPKTEALFDALCGKSTQSIHDAHYDWADAGCPVVEEPTQTVFPLLTSNGQILNLTGNINMDAYPELRQAIVDAAKRKEELAAANARIKELEDEKRSLQARLRLDLHLDGRDAGIWNEALEEAANLFQGHLDTPYSAVNNAIAEKIRGLKK